MVKFTKRLIPCYHAKSEITTWNLSFVDILSSPEARDSSDLTEVSCKHFILTAAHSQIVSLFKNTFLVLEYFYVATDFLQQPMYSSFKVQISGEPFNLLPDIAIIQHQGCEARFIPSTELRVFSRKKIKRWDNQSHRTLYKPKETNESFFSNDNTAIVRDTD